MITYIPFIRRSNVTILKTIVFIPYVFVTLPLIKCNIPEINCSYFVTGSDRYTCLILRLVVGDVPSLVTMDFGTSSIWSFTHPTYPQVYTNLCPSLKIKQIVPSQTYQNKLSVPTINDSNNTFGPGEGDNPVRCPGHSNRGSSNNHLHIQC